MYHLCETAKNVETKWFARSSATLVGMHSGRKHHFSSSQSVQLLEARGPDGQLPHRQSPRERPDGRDAWPVEWLSGVRLQVPFEGVPILKNSSAFCFFKGTAKALCPDGARALSPQVWGFRFRCLRLGV